MITLETLISSRIGLAYCIDLKVEKVFNIIQNIQFNITFLTKLLHLLTSLRLSSGLKGWGTDERPLMVKDSFFNYGPSQAPVLICKIVCQNARRV